MSTKPVQSFLPRFFKYIFVAFMSLCLAHTPITAQAAKAKPYRRAKKPKAIPKKIQTQDQDLSDFPEIDEEEFDTASMSQAGNLEIFPFLGVQIPKRADANPRANLGIELNYYYRPNLALGFAAQYGKEERVTSTSEFHFHMLMIGLHNDFYLPASFIPGLFVGFQFNFMRVEYYTVVVGQEESAVDQRPLTLAIGPRAGYSYQINDWFSACAQMNILFSPAAAPLTSFWTVGFSTGGKFTF